MIDGEERPASASKPRGRPGSLLLTKARRHPLVLDGAIAVTILLVPLWAYSPLAQMRFAPYDLGRLCTGFASQSAYDHRMLWF